MIANELESIAREAVVIEMPLLNSGKTSVRFETLFETGRKDLSLAKICEAHWDAIGILSEAGKYFNPKLLYGVWAAEIPGNVLKLEKNKSNHWILSGTKMFCSGAGLIDRVLITAITDHPVLIDLDLKKCMDKLTITNENWFSKAFEETKTATVVFNEINVDEADIINNADWYITRPGFWAGAIGPAACWAGGAAGLVDYALVNKRNDPHTLAHLAAMNANIWSMRSILRSAGHEVDENFNNTNQIHKLALMVRHSIEQLCTDVLRRFSRAYGPFPLACIEKISKRYVELDLYLRQNHAERDLENLGKLIFPPS